MTHTKGPWHVDCSGNGDVWSKDCKIADTKNPAQDAIYRTASDDERRANARLIAAAPDLLEACVTFISALDGDAIDYDNLAAATRAAIAKARGETTA